MNEPSDTPLKPTELQAGMLYDYRVSPGDERRLAHVVLRDGSLFVEFIDKPGKFVLATRLKGRFEQVGRVRGAGTPITFRADAPRRFGWGFFPPVVYRYMDQVYIDEFFATGRLMLSSYQRFREHQDEQRGDPHEGYNFINGTADNLTVVANMQVGSNALVFCTSIREDRRLMRQFESNGYFRVTEPNAFGRAIAAKLPGCIGGAEGLCTYRSKHVISRALNAEIAEKLGSNALSDQEHSALLRQVAGDDVLFTKRKRFAHQFEYRILWFLDRDVSGAVFVDCPEAIQFCERVT